MKFPLDNQLTDSRITLGKKIFFDANFSSDKKISCSSCHKPQFAFADTLPTNKGSHDSINFRNVPSLINIGYHPYLNLDGGVPSIEMQVFVPMESATEMNTNLLKAAAYMKTIPEYVNLSIKAYKRQPDAYVIIRALAAYQRSLISKGSRYDLFKATKGKKGLTAIEIKGMNLFYSSKTMCSTCHSGFLFTNFMFEDIGLPNHTKDTGRARVTIKQTDIGKFKTPSLRNVSLTKPYMHDGSIKTLDEVLHYFNNGGGHSRNKSKSIKSLHLSNEEIYALKAFLLSLTDTLSN
jgi:cytochrome c peroxidase